MLTSTLDSSVPTTLEQSFLGALPHGAGREGKAGQAVLNLAGH